MPVAFLLSNWRWIALALAFAALYGWGAYQSHGRKVAESALIAAQQEIGQRKAERDSAIAAGALCSAAVENLRLEGLQRAKAARTALAAAETQALAKGAQVAAVEALLAASRAKPASGSLSGTETGAQPASACPAGDALQALRGIK